MTNTRTSLGHQPSTLNYPHALSYTRGKDLSGALEEAGGIGGLLARSDGYSAGNWTNHNYYFTDGNGNITYMINRSQAMVASYRYDPFGNTISSSGSLSAANVYRFSSKEIHGNSGMYYYLYRFYDPSLQRWVNRDPSDIQCGNCPKGTVTYGMSYQCTYIVQIGDTSWPDFFAGYNTQCSPGSGDPYPRITFEYGIEF